MPGSRLDEIVRNKEQEVAERKRSQATASLAQRVERADRRFLRAITQPGKLNLIAEVKPKSPSQGVLRQNVSVDEILAAYDKYASAISVLTDEKYFGGSLDLLASIAARTTRPALCKDFIIDPHQCFEARLNGAQAVLLIVKILDRTRLCELHSIIVDLGMVPVVEVQTERELETALAAEPSVILINNRNLDTFEIDLATTEKLAALVPSSAVTVSASGIESQADLERLRSFCQCFLIGSSIMKADNIEEKLRELAGVAACAEAQEKERLA